MKQEVMTLEERIKKLPEIGQAAIKYARRGWLIFPCYPKTKIPLKELAPHGFHRATKNLETICSWWEQYPDANVAIRTGKPSEIWVLDIDGAVGKTSLIELQEQYGELAYPMMVETPGGGLHLYYTYPPDGEVGCRTNVRPGIDVRGDGGYVVAPPSIHPEGGRYEWLT